jgi:hypothetical protein
VHVNILVEIKGAAVSTTSLSSHASKKAQERETSQIADGCGRRALCHHSNTRGMTKGVRVDFIFS